MGIFEKGDIVISKISFENSHGSKIRPTLIILDEYITKTSFNNFVVLPITSTSHFDDYSISIYATDIKTGRIENSPSYVRVNKPHVLPRNKLRNKIATLKEEKMEEITEVWKKYQE